MARGTRSTGDPLRDAERSGAAWALLLATAPRDSASCAHGERLSRNAAESPCLIANSRPMCDRRGRERRPAATENRNMNATTKITLDLAKTLAKSGFHIPRSRFIRPTAASGTSRRSRPGAAATSTATGARGPERWAASASSRSTARTTTPPTSTTRSTAILGPPMSWSTTSGQSASRRTRPAGTAATTTTRRPEARDLRASLFSRDHHPKGARS